MSADRDQTATRTRLGALVQAGFFLSGVTGLVYQVVWLRVLATAYGSTTLATSVVLTAFMGGLALGSLLGGRKADAVARPFRLYAWLELGIGVYCFASLWLLFGVREVYLGAARRIAFESPVLAALQFALTVAVLIIPTALMGATLPVVSRGFVRRIDQVGTAVANLYGINTFGAVLGVALAGFVMLPVLGLRATTWGAAAVNLLIGTAILLAERGAGQGPAANAPQPDAQDAEAPALPRRLSAVLLVGFGLSGMAALALEVAWTRALVMMTGSSIYAFTSILVAVLAGIALGSLAVGRIWGERPMSPLWFGGVEALLGLSCLGVSWVIGLMPTTFLGLFVAYSRQFSALMATELVTILLVLAVPTLLMGATMPILSRVYITRSGRVGTMLGRAYAANTVGAIVGSFAAGYVVIPLIGVRPTILAAAAVYAAVGIAVWLAGPRRRWTAAAAAATAVATIAAVALLPSWRRTVMSAGVFLGIPEIDAKKTRIEFYKEGPTCTVAVLRSEDGTLTLTVNAKPDATTGEDMGTQLALGHVPVLLAEHPKRALIIGLGSGITAGAVAQHPVERIDVVEIEPAVARAARYFAEANREVLDDPRFRLFLGDARSYVASTRVKYDVISSEPSNPWIAGIGSLFTVEHFRDCRRVLAPGGVICQWIHGTRIGTDDLATVARSFMAVFPEATLWTTGTAEDLLLVSGRDGPVLHFAALRERMERSGVFAREPESEWMPSAMTVAGRLIMGPEDLRRFAQAGRLNTDDLPTLEFSAPRSLYAGPSYEQNAEALAEALSKPPVDLMDLAGAGMTYGEFVSRLAEARPPGVHVFFEKASALDLASLVSREPGNAEAHYLLGIALAQQGDTLGARRALRAAVALAPDNAQYRQALEGL